jgi:hypothetical protein
MVGQARRDCRTACAERSTCTAPGARIRTLAYVVSECTTDPQGRDSWKQKLLIRRGNCDPVTVMETAPSTPVLGPNVCGLWGESRYGTLSPLFGAFQRMAVLPDGSGVVFEVTTQFSRFPDRLGELPEGEGIFFVRADGSGLRRLGPALRLPVWFVPPDDPRSPFGSPRRFTGIAFPVSPNGRSIALIDLGPDTAGHEATQLFLLDLRSGRRTQLTQLSRVATFRDPGIRRAAFLDNRTVSFYTGVPEEDMPVKIYRVKTDGSGVPEEIPPFTLTSGARVIAQFGVTGTHPHVVLGFYPDRQPVRTTGATPPQVLELFLVDSKNLLQLTNFGRDDTGLGWSYIARGRVFFTASANPFGENPAEICQVFSMNRFGKDLRQLTNLPSNGRPYSGCWPGGPGRGNACSMSYWNTVVDRVTGIVLFGSSCDPVGGNPVGDQLFAMRPDGSGLRQLTATRGRTIDPDGTVHVEMPGPIAYPVARP